jgi:hypothetical protein
MGLLDELKREAEAIRQIQAGERVQRDEYLGQAEAAMIRALKYFGELLKQLDVIRPVNPTVYMIPHVGALDGLKLAETFIDSRKKRIGEGEYYDYIRFLVTWSGEPPLFVERDMPLAIQRVRDSLWGHNLRFSEEEVKSAASATLKAVFTIPRRVVTEVTLRANHEQGTIDVIARNLLRLGPDDFRIPANDVREDVLEEVAQALLGRKSALAPYRTVIGPVAANKAPEPSLRAM